jgi:hypothetical protein
MAIKAKPARVSAVRGYVVSGPRGFFPHTFSLSKAHALEAAPAIVVLNKYAAREVTVRLATLTVDWGEDFTAIRIEDAAKLDAHVAEMRRKIQIEANRVRRGKRR